MIAKLKNTVPLKPQREITSHLSTQPATTKAPGLPDEGFVKVPQIIAVFPVSRSGWWQGVKDGKYPAPVKLSPKITAWRVQDIRKLIADYSNASNDAQA